MLKIRWFASVMAVAALLLAAAGTTLVAQVTTGSVAGRVVGEDGDPLADVQIQVRNAATGASVGSVTRSDGRFAVLGLEVGTQYEVTARRIGYAPTTVSDVRVQLSQATPVNLTLRTQAVQLTAVTVSADAERSLIAPDRQGTQTTIGDTLLRRLPTLNRNFTDFVALTPQVAGAGPGLSGGGTNNRFNNIQIDGATEADLFGLGSTGQPGGQAGGKSISIESVKEYQVLLAPYDVRQGNFSGVLINAVTKSGQNRFFGSAYAFGRNQDLTRSQDYITEFEQSQYGFSLGGPIVRDRVLFFVNPEFQRRTAPAGGPAIGDAGLTLTQGQVDQFTEQLALRGLTNLGSATRVENENPLTNVFARLDFILPWNSTFVIRHNYGSAVDDNFSRSRTGSSPAFGLTNSGYEFTSDKNATVAQLRSNFNNGAFNELIVGYTTIRDRRATPGSLQPQVNVTIAGTATLIGGTERSSQANELDQDIIEVTNNYTLPIGLNHRVTVGTQNQFYKFRNLFGQNSVGEWTFGSLDSLVLGRPNRYRVGFPAQAGTDGSVRVSSAQFAAYAQDEWTLSDQFNVNIGLRVDVPTFGDRPPYNPIVDQGFGRRTDQIPSANIQFSPRVGFNWDVTGNRQNQLRGGVGMFVGRPAFVWLSNSFQNSGLTGYQQLDCNTAALAPQFTAAAAATPPGTCSDLRGPSAGAEINLLNRDLKFPQNLRATLGFDRQLLAGYVLTLEGIYTRGINNLLYQNIALARDTASTAVFGADGRFLYGDTPGNPVVRVAGRRTVLDVVNQSEDYSYNLTAGVTRQFANNFGGSLFYTFSDARDVVNLTSSTAGSQYQFGRSIAGRQTDLDLATSIFSQPHRIIATGTYTLPTRTSISAIYSGGSGQAFNYVSSGDLNGDGVIRNDRVYVPAGPSDPLRPVFQQFTTGSGPSAVINTPQQQEAAFFEFIENSDCLRDQRGRLMDRNSCRAPFVNQVDLALEQAIGFSGQSFTVRLDVINFTNLLNSDWGLVRSQGFGAQNLYTQQGVTNSNNLRTGVPLVRFDPNFQQFNAENLSSNYQMQLSLRYAF